MTVRKICCMLLILITVFMTASCCALETGGETGYRAVIDDQAGLLKETELPEIMEALKKVTVHCHAGVLTRSRDNASSLSQSSDVEAVALKWGKDTFGDTGFIVFFIDMKTRNVCISANQDISRRFTNADADIVTDNIYRDAKNEQYGRCAVNALEQIAQVLDGEQIARPMKYISNVLIAVCLSVILCFAIVSGTLKKRNAAEAVKITATVAAGAGTALLAKKLVRTVHHDSSSGGGHGGHGGGFGGGGGHHSGGHHGF